MDMNIMILYNHIMEQILKRYLSRFKLFNFNNSERAYKNIFW